MSAADADAKQEPNVCPDPGEDVPHGASERAQRYQEQISALINPQRPLPAGLAVSLINPVTGKPVVFDECRESDGTMIEAKGPGFANLLENAIVAPGIVKKWTDQAQDQVAASGGRGLEWSALGRFARLPFVDQMVPQNFQHALIANYGSRADLEKKLGQRVEYPWEKEETAPRS